MPALDWGRKCFSIRPWTNQSPRFGQRLCSAQLLKLDPNVKSSHSGLRPKVAGILACSPQRCDNSHGLRVEAKEISASCTSGATSCPRTLVICACIAIYGPYALSRSFRLISSMSADVIRSEVYSLRNSVAICFEAVLFLCSRAPTILLSSSSPNRARDLLRRWAPRCPIRYWLVNMCEILYNNRRHAPSERVVDVDFKCAGDLPGGISYKFPC